MQIRLLQVINDLNTGGAEKLLADAVPLYQEKGLETDVLLLNGSQTDLLEKLESESNGQVYSLGRGSVYNPFLIFRMFKLLRKYDIVHVHLFPALYWTALAKGFSNTAVKLIYTEHSTSNKRMRNPFIKQIDRYIYNFYDRIITIADRVDKNLKNYLSLTPDLIEQVNNGINTQLFENAKTYNKSKFYQEEDSILIQVSNFRRPKDQATLVKALEILPQNVKLLLVGDGPLKKHCEKLVNELGLGKRVKFLGTRMDVPRLLKTADIVVLSSHYEGLSLSSLEGMAAGKPFIASDVPGLRKIVSGAGLLFEKEDEKGLAKHIQDLLQMPNYYDEIAQKCSERASKFDIKAMVDRYINLYKNVIND